MSGGYGDYAREEIGLDLIGRRVIQQLMEATRSWWRMRMSIELLRDPTNRHRLLLSITPAELMALMTACPLLASTLSHQQLLGVAARSRISDTEVSLSYASPIFLAVLRMERQLEALQQNLHDHVFGIAPV